MNKKSEIQNIQELALEIKQRAEFHYKLCTGKDLQLGPATESLLYAIAETFSEKTRTYVTKHKT